ncbi:hypothetical protein [Streptomyces sp. NPDC006879]|uniref:hypothetical protein n=1 Tax=Streptomyces sp. NPDC006879 TaxID=3364767 RepID=UPI00367484FD
MRFALVQGGTRSLVDAHIRPVDGAHHQLDLIEAEERRRSAKIHVLSEIALGIQLKHAVTRALANRSTQGYAGSDTAWAERLGTAIDHARFRRLKDLYDQHHEG